jgi:hypothetical protein
MTGAAFGWDFDQQRIRAQVEGYYGRSAHRSTPDRSAFLGGFATLGYRLRPDRKVSPYLRAGAGILNHYYQPVQGSGQLYGKPALTAALGLQFRAGRMVGFFTEARLLSTSDDTILPVMAGVAVAFRKQPHGSRIPRTKQ